MKSVMNKISLRTQLLKINYQKLTNWSWEMFRTLVLMMESFDINEICLKKKPLSKCLEEYSRKNEEEDEEYILVLDLDETLIHADIKKECADDHEIRVLILISNKLGYGKQETRNLFCEKTAVSNRIFREDVPFLRVSSFHCIAEGICR